MWMYKYPPVSPTKFAILGDAYLTIEISIEEDPNKENMEEVSE